MYKIIINEQLLIFCLSSDIDKYKSDEKALVVMFRGVKRQFFPFIDSMEKNKEDRVIVLHSYDLKGMFKMFLSIFKVVKAAGGIVRNDKDEILFIFRRGYWDLPKGKLDPGEKKKDAAVREVMEETGVQHVELFDKVGKSYHVYRDKKNLRCMKLSHWYRMRSSDVILQPQLEEDIEIAKWDNTESILKDYRPIYASILDILQKEEKMQMLSTSCL